LRRFILGLAPSSSEWSSSQSLERLAEWTGLGRAPLLEVPQRNVWRSSYQAGAGRRELEATGRGCQLRAELAGAHVLALGPRAPWLLWAGVWRPFQFRTGPGLAGAVVLVIPSPSGRDRAYNDPELRRLVGGLVRAWCLEDLDVVLVA